MSCIDIPIHVLLLQGIPEQIGMVALAYAITKLPFRWKEIIPLGVLLALTAYVIRSMSMPFGTHTLAIIFILFIFLMLKGKEIITSLITTLLCLVAISIFELISISSLMAIFNTSQEAVFTDPIKRVLFTEPQVILLFVTAFIVRRKREKND
ncbi:hypothetical protein Desdi_0669 [Desulfitobacterium dichloroeliminans LMG P-21439]|uniref:Uncharacterized protein n=1 Tax=Desulfitobacterium dichloroeliminans (strain LMG P-21439 / DCA1) TaxID=871963 RepID=L0F5H5_DESDL|nr:hypothetical protein [Desulfitobacterium dichloroeliminans]AGA68198.1 hypothetical protein Desdi_0669 [Desulfitobacterium dichloroeliminans LMG P-21439]